MLTPLPQTAVHLSSREQEVAVLIAYGLTNKQIAQHLIIAPRTADNHVQHIFDKLGVSSRALVAAWAALEGMLNQPYAVLAPTRPSRENVRAA